MIKVAIASGKGGTGKTYVSTNLFYIMREAGLSVAMVDCDAEEPNDILFLPGQLKQQWPVDVFLPRIDVDKCVLCGHCAEVCHFHAITCIPAAHYIKVMPDLCHACTACLAVCPSEAIEQEHKIIGNVSAYGDEISSHLFEAKIKEGEHSPVSIIRQALRKAELEDTDYLILDAPPGCACPFVNTVKDADLVFLVTEPTPFGLSDLKHTIEVLRRLNKPFQVLINRSDIGDDTMKTYLKEQKIPLLAELPYSENVAVAYSKGMLGTVSERGLKDIFVCIMNKILEYENSCH